jgi:hypothetical protein
MLWSGLPRQIRRALSCAAIWAGGGHGDAGSDDLTGIKRVVGDIRGGTDMIGGLATASASQSRPMRSDASIPIRTIASLLRAHQVAEH